VAKQQPPDTVGKQPPDNLAKQPPDIVGKWENVDRQQFEITMEFRRDGTGEILIAIAGAYQKTLAELANLEAELARAKGQPAREYTKRKPLKRDITDSCAICATFVNIRR